MTMLQSLTRTVGLDRERMVALDAMRKQRNVADWSGAPVRKSAVEAPWQKRSACRMISG